MLQQIHEDPHTKIYLDTVLKLILSQPSYGQEGNDINSGHYPGKYNSKNYGPTQGQVIGDYANVHIHLYSSQNEPKPSQKSSSNKSDLSQVSHHAQPQQRKVVHLFYSYADSDQSLLKRFEKHFSYLRRERYIQDWHVGKLKGGDDPDEHISKHLRQADIILLLISSDYVSSEDLDRQAQVAMERQQTNNVIVVPILLRPVADWKKEPYGTLQALPRNGRWISGYPDPDQPFAEIAEEISTIVARLREQ